MKRNSCGSGFSKGIGMIIIGSIAVEPGRTIALEGLEFSLGLAS